MASKFTSFLRSATNDFAQFLRAEGLLAISPDQESKLAELIERFNDETYGSTSPQGRRPKSKVQVVSSESVTYNREYLAALSVRLGRKLNFKSDASGFIGDDQANHLHSPAMRGSWAL